ncbi:hypothetical protein BST81_14925 [Leptolyngbya sp. 'hensonii']|nr:hypothetical protein BST81_14925 [Leptolyngbya sp. 'hensonii']
MLLLSAMLPANALSVVPEASQAPGEKASGSSDAAYLLADKTKDDDDDDDDEDDDDDDDDDDDEGGRYDRKRDRYRNWHKKGNKRRKCFDSTTVYETRRWRSSVTMTRLVQTNSMVVYFDVLDKPATRYANAVYVLYAWKNERWEQIYTSTGARLINKQAGRFALQPEVIDLDKLNLQGIDLATTRIKSVVQIRYDTAEKRDRKLNFTEIWDYRSITQVNNVQQVIDISNNISTVLLGQSQGNSSNPVMQSITLANGFRVSYLGVIYSDRQSTWRYKIEETSGSRDLSNWVLGLPGCVRVANLTPRGERVNPDPNARISGIKWQTSRSFQSGEFTITLNGRHTVGSITVAAKGPDVARGTLPGPSCAIQGLQGI